MEPLARLDYLGESPDRQRTRIRMFGVFAKALVHMAQIQVPEAESAACEQAAEGLLASYEAN